LLTAERLAAGACAIGVSMFGAAASRLIIPAVLWYRSARETRSKVTEGHAAVAAPAESRRGSGEA